jgi:hypothetical protein
MRDLPFELLIGRTLKVSAFLLAPALFLLVSGFATPVAWGLLIGIGTGMWNSYFLLRRIKLVDPGDRLYRHRLLQSLLTGLVFRLLTTIAMLYVASRISVSATIAAAAGILAVWGIFAAISAGALVKEAAGAAGVRRGEPPAVSRQR